MKYVGLYQTDPLTLPIRFGQYAGASNIVTVTLSLLADGSYEQESQGMTLYLPGQTPSVEPAPGGGGGATGRWAEQGDGIALFDEQGEVATLTMAEDGSLVYWHAAQRVGLLLPRRYTLHRIAATPTRPVTDRVRAAIAGPLAERAHQVDPALAGYYTSTAQFIPELGNVAVNLSLFPDGWAEYQHTVEGNAHETHWGIWSVDAAQATLTILDYGLSFGRDHSLNAPLDAGASAVPVFRFRINGDTLTTNDWWGETVLARAGESAVPLVPGLHASLFPEPAPQPSVPASMPAGVDPALVGLYESGMVTRTLMGRNTTRAITVTLSLFGDGTYEEMTVDALIDKGVAYESWGTFQVMGLWSVRDDRIVLFDDGKEVATLTPRPDGALSMRRLRSVPGPRAFALQRISTVPAPIFGPAVRAAMLPAIQANAAAVDPALAGTYLSDVRFVPEFGNGAMRLHLYENGWAEYFFGYANGPTWRDTAWGLWSVDRRRDATVRVVIYGTEDTFGVPGMTGWPETYSFTRDGDRLTSVIPYPGFVLERTAAPPAPVMFTLYSALFPASPPAPAAAPAEPVTSTVNSALVGLYQSDVITWPVEGLPYAGAMTVTLSLFADGTYEEMIDEGLDWGTHRVPQGVYRSTGQWADQGEVAVLSDDQGQIATFMTIGSDALAVTRTRTEEWRRPLSWVLTRISETPEYAFYTRIKADMLPVLFNNTAADPTVVGGYSADKTFVPEMGEAALTLNLNLLGWAEFRFDFADGSAMDTTEWGLWSTSGEDGNTVKVVLYGSDSLIGAPGDGSYWPRTFEFVREGDTLTEVAQGWGFVLPRTTHTPATLLPEMFDHIFAAPAPPPASVSPEAPVAAANPALVGLYQSDVITTAALHAPGYEALTVTLSLFDDGTYDELLARDYYQEGSVAQFGLYVSSGRWADRGEASVLFDDAGEVATFFTIGSDALAAHRIRTEGWYHPLDWVMTRIDDAPEPLFHCAAKQALHTSRSDPAHAPDPAAAGVYTGQTESGEFGTDTCTLALYADGWAESYCGPPQVSPSQVDAHWGLWWAGAGPEAAIIVATYGWDDVLLQPGEDSFRWNGNGFLRLGGIDQTGVHATTYTRSDTPLAPQMDALHAFVFTEPAGACHWERE